MSELTTPVSCPQGLVQVTEPIGDLNLRHVYFKDVVIGTVKHVGQDRYTIKAKQGVQRKEVRYSLNLACCTILTSHLVSYQGSQKGLAF